MRARFLVLLGLLALLGCCALVHAADKSSSIDDYNPDDYDATYYGEEDDSYMDSYGYMDNDDDEYYEYYGYYSGDGGFDDADGEGEGEGDYYEEYDEYDEEPTLDQNVCVMDSGSVKLNNKTEDCAIKIEGVDNVADNQPGGIDGVYKLTGCLNGRPLYTRENSPESEPRVLWYNSKSNANDWELSVEEPGGDVDILLYGGENQHASVPVYVSSWFLSADLSNSANGDDLDYIPIKLRVSCADGSKPAAGDPLATHLRAQKPKQALTEEEVAARYKYVYQQYGHRREPNPIANFSFVVLLVLVGLTSVLAIPYMLLRKPGKSGKVPPIAASFAQIIQQSKKKQSGHYN